MLYLEAYFVNKGEFCVPYIFLEIFPNLIDRLKNLNYTEFNTIVSVHENVSEAKEN